MRQQVVQVVQVGLVVAPGLFSFSLERSEVRNTHYYVASLYHRLHLQVVSL